MSEEEKHSQESSDQSILNPLERALMELHEAYIKPEMSDLCQSNEAVMAECHVCTELTATPGGNLCCTDVDQFISCHIRVLEFFDEMGNIESNVIQQHRNPYDMDTFDNEINNGIRKRYGSTFSKWGWSPKNKRNDMDKRYGTLWGNIGKRYGTVFGNIGKRYGTLFGGSLFNKGKKTDKKRYGSLFGKTFSSRTG